MSSEDTTVVATRGQACQAPRNHGSETELGKRTTIE